MQLINFLGYVWSIKTVVYLLGGTARKIKSKLLQMLCHLHQVTYLPEREGDELWEHKHEGFTYLR